jgi:hypothetical protein
VCVSNELNPYFDFDFTPTCVSLRGVKEMLVALTSKRNSRVQKPRVVAAEAKATISTPTLGFKFLNYNKLRVIARGASRTTVAATANLSCLWARAGGTDCRQERI